MLMSVKMSVGVRSPTTGVRIRISSAITTNVYGLRNAKATIHIDYSLGHPGENLRLQPPRWVAAQAEASIEANRCETVRIGFIFDKVGWPCRDSQPPATKLCHADPAVRAARRHARR